MTRRANDYYPTPGMATKLLLEYCPELLIKRKVLEPCAGDGAIARVLADHYEDVGTNDIDPLWDCDLSEDAKQLKTQRVVITNPPFNQAIEIVSNFVEQGTPCAFFLRLSFLEPTDDRGEWLARNPPAGMIVLPRISFTGDGKTDRVTCAWMLWNVSPFGVFVVPKVRFFNKVIRD